METVGFRRAGSRRKRQIGKEEVGLDEGRLTEGCGGGNGAQRDSKINLSDFEFEYGT